MTERRESVRTIRRGHRGNRGRATAAKAGGRADFESTLERDFYFLLELDPSVECFTPQPVSLTFKGPNERRRRYVPDALIEYRDGRPPCLVEIKYVDELRKDPALFRLRFQAAREYARTQGWTFCTFTEKAIRTQRLRNVTFLRPYLDPKRRFDPEIRAELLSRAARSHSGTLEDLLTGLSLAEKGHFLPVLWHLVATFQIPVSLDKPLTLRTPLQRNA